MRDGGTNADELHALAVEAAAADDDDIGFRAMTLAAERGSAEASLQVGKWYDPGIREGSPFPIPDPSAAARHYLAAEETGSEEAGPLRRKLCELAEQARMRTGFISKHSRLILIAGKRVSRGHRDIGPTCWNRYETS
ncbi:hypothetical protein [Breoghania sp. L-A4]|uniref:hypothetical protein n=1 Tax=Breoghania sp. L-A4 TaxID=2304600 RepID=UPI000E35B2FA|nr:hypothetical protein [Breoghania sp. L-A4]AXS40691.1 hypothetical protein D1F64_12265 [Breoghania sp. L-A4]